MAGTFSDSLSEYDRLGDFDLGGPSSMNPTNDMDPFVFGFDDMELADDLDSFAIDFGIIRSGPNPPVDSPALFSGVNQVSAHSNGPTTTPCNPRAARELQDPYLRPFECTKCGWRFPLRKSLNRHVKSVHGPRSFSCEECPVVVGRKDILTRHIATAHSGRSLTRRGTPLPHRAPHGRLRNGNNQGEACPSIMPLLTRTALPELITDPFVAVLKMMQLFHISHSDRSQINMLLVVPPGFHADRYGALRLRMYEMIRTSLHTKCPGTIFLLWLSILLLSSMEKALPGNEDWKMHQRGAAALIAYCQQLP